MEILTSPRAIETDWLQMSGNLTPEQAEQYLTASGDLDNCIQKLTLDQSLFWEVSVTVTPTCSPVCSGQLA